MKKNKKCNFQSEKWKRKVMGRKGTFVFKPSNEAFTMNRRENTNSVRQKGLCSSRVRIP